MNLHTVQHTLGKLFSEIEMAVEILLPSGKILHLGEGKQVGVIAIHSRRAAGKLLSLDQNGIAESYLRGELDIEGSFMDILRCRSLLKEKQYGLSWFTRFATPALFGQVFTNRIAIRKHYELNPEFYLSFLDATWPAYSQGIYQDYNEPLATTIERKFAFAVEACGLSAGSHVLEVGPGWGAFIKYLIPKGINVTAITISPQSKAFLEATFPSPNLRVLHDDFLLFSPKEKFDAVSIMGVLEHLPDYSRVCRQLKKILKPGGYAYMDASACEYKYEMSRFIYKHVFPYNHSFLHLAKFLEAAKKEGLELVSLHDDSQSYQYTVEIWARNLESKKNEIRNRYGEYNFRRFLLYLWGSVLAFEEGNIQCHRIVLRNPF